MAKCIYVQCTVVSFITEGCCYIIVICTNRVLSIHVHLHVVHDILYMYM